MASSTAAAMADMGMDMDMDMDMGAGACKISMLWNWYTVDSCFLASSWHNTSKGMFAGSCIGVIFLVISLEMLRRAGKEYDRYILAQYTQSSTSAHASSISSTAGLSTTNFAKDSPAPSHTPVKRFRPSVAQQAVRALLHMAQFAVAYIIMLLAMYFNGYIIICIFIGAFLGFFAFGWESLAVGQGANDRLQEEVTVCCG
ncbi:Ctr-domain-containing protein [Pleomassaria siparia CBS 279.74]|uniref:Copper transport protein n=1 Tax=Pleomassaria siparia CBS 279.74 TaxID=1314801 RepID=A0A6G1JRA3_9PLEO|nr:Ctr-domain-containing protein [Pleomassaria siparia CBS 279.74]